nr:hypothetical protein [uncultured Campylobacter sp.]
MTQGLGILNGILYEIASVVLFPCNDGILEFPSDEIIGSSPMMTQSGQGGQFL